jgi:hypothetical protein
MTERTTPFAAWASAQSERLEARNAELEAEIVRLRTGLDKSVKLQSHYAALLNDYDRGKRLQFADADAWLQRLAALEADAARRAVRGEEAQ